MTSREYYQQKARQCRRLADSVNDNFAQAGLIALAEEFDAKAEFVEAKDALDTAHQRSVDLLGNGPLSPTEGIARPKLNGDGTAPDVHGPR